MIDEARLAKALTYLATTDEPCAELRTDMERAEFKAKAIKDTLFRLTEGRSVADRQAEAGTAAQYTDAMDAYFDAMQQYEAMRNKRTTESIVVETWRSLNASRRQGNV
jgi:SOS response regulatory protein OraA/RecX